MTGAIINSMPPVLSRFPRSRGGTDRRAGAAMLMALFVMTVTTIIVISIVDTEILQYASLRNTFDWDRARYLAEAGTQHAFAELESNIQWREGIPRTEFPAGSGQSYSATVTDGPAGSVIVTSWGTSGTVTRSLQTTLKQGG
ncbi:MAG: hypothetical protein SFX18_02975 [Pirellulales bacterium]|nr:hypothetical protein [Pirellulales bacterium]